MMKKFLNGLVQASLRWRRLREHLAFQIRQRHFDLLQIRVPLSANLVAPVLSDEAWISFSEIFLQGEYGQVFRLLPLPVRWIDLGCHAGFFSLFVEQGRRLEGRGGTPQALLVDADTRSARAIERVIALNGLQGQMRFQHGAVSAGTGTVPFSQRAFMASGVTAIDDHPGERAAVPIITPDRIVELISPPYDLVKVDIEGSEHDFIGHYRPVWSAARHLVLECHDSPHTGDAWETGADRIVASTGFERLQLEDRPDEPERHAGLLVLRNPAFDSAPTLAGAGARQV